VPGSTGCELSSFFRAILWIAGIVSPAAVYWPVAQIVAAAIARRRHGKIIPALRLTGGKRDEYRGKGKTRRPRAEHRAGGRYLGAAAQSTIRAVLQPPQSRKAAPEFSLKDSSGTTARLSEYRGKVVVLDFWATWCTGCKKEIPWFSEFQRQYAKEGLAVVGVSMDEKGWPAVKPFLAEHAVPYRMLLGNESTAKSYGIEGMPDTFLIDRQGRVAAAYIAGIVDREDIEANIRRVLSDR
jgi:peroxiredoxin